MTEEIKFGYFERKDYFNVEFKEFDKRFILGKSSKFIQLYINREPIIIAGNDLYHRDILRLYLEKFNLKFGTRLNVSKDEIPLEKGENYELVGAGRVKLFGDKLNFYDNSSDYIARIKGTDKKHLENMFGSENITEVENEIPFLFVEFFGNSFSSKHSIKNTNQNYN